MMIHLSWDVLVFFCKYSITREKCLINSLIHTAHLNRSRRSLEMVSNPLSKWGHPRLSTLIMLSPLSTVIRDLSKEYTNPTHKVLSVSIDKYHWVFHKNICTTPTDKSTAGAVLRKCQMWLRATISNEHDDEIKGRLTTSLTKHGTSCFYIVTFSYSIWIQWSLILVLGHLYLLHRYGSGTMKLKWTLQLFTSRSNSVGPVILQ